MTNKTAARKYRVHYAVTRSEFYAIEAATPEQAKALAFSDGELVEHGETTNVTDCGVEEIGDNRRRYTVQAFMLTGDEVAIEATDADAARKAAAAHFETKYPESTCEITQVDVIEG